VRLHWNIGILMMSAACGGSIVPNGTGAGGGGGASWDPSNSGLPCDVANFIASKCITCHGPGTSTVLTSRDALLGSSTVSGQTVAVRSVARLQAASQPMPPAGFPAATPLEVSAFSAWVEGGMPAGSCAAIDPGVIDPICTSGSLWTQGNRESRDMNPGRACLACHTSQQEQDKQFPFSGTVYPTHHEKDLCNGLPPLGVKVEIYDRNGRLALTMMPEPKSGNFHSDLSVSVALPYTAQVVSSTGVAKMIQPQTSGDCNGCHTVLGANGAIGRIVWP
jgi:hypothetical protein